MARIAGIELPSNKKVVVGLTAIYGIGPPLAKQILSISNISSDTRIKDLTEAQISKLHKIIEGNYMIEGDLRRKTSSDINRLISIKCYRGIRHKMGLPVRGQRTKCNARTRKGPRKVLGSRKKR